MLHSSVEDLKEMSYIISIGNTSINWLLPPPLFEDQPFGNYIFHVRCFSLREKRIEIDNTHESISSTRLAQSKKVHNITAKTE
jgi:hypothetical protein